MAIKVLIVDDSALVRTMIGKILASDPEFEVVGAAADPYQARELIKRLNPDVLTLDVEMPKMDGLTFLRHLMRLRPMPVLMVSSLTQRNADVTMEALAAGAVDFVPKPSVGVAGGFEELADELVSKLKVVARARVSQRCGAPNASTAAHDKSRSQFRTTDRLIAFGASTGGTEAIAELLERFPPDAPGVVIVQHIPELFSQRFAERLNGSSSLVVSEAKDGDPVLLGHAYVAPGNQHLRVVRSGARYFCRVTRDDRVNRHRPSVDVLFDSVAREVGSSAVGVILTGMGDDGANGLLAMRQAGSATIAQDAKSSVVWGMPGEAVRRGAVDEVLPLDRIAERALELARDP
jgi:two-component system, chemotaxis family, protein-glutamate methylesterase/glutaminase